MAKERQVVLPNGDRVILSLDASKGFPRLVVRYPDHFDPASKDATQGREILGLVMIARTLLDLGFDENLEPIEKEK